MEDHDDTRAAWMMLGVTVAFKVGLTLWILIAYPSTQNFVVNLALNWPWLILMGAVLIGLFAAPVLFRYRLRRVRSKRARLQHAEWHVD